MDIVKAKELTDTVNTLIMNSNGWEQIESWFAKNKAIQPYYEKISDEYTSEGCFGKATIMLGTIELLLEKAVELDSLE